MMKTINISLNAEGKKQFQDSLSRLNSEEIISRIWKHDHTVWKEDPTEISNRLGWLHCYETMFSHLSEIESFVNEVRAAGYTHALLLGMGGSSLAPEIMRFIFGVKKGYLELSVLDSTDPAAVLEKQQGLNPEKTLIVVSTKSGGTIETLSFMKYFYNVFLKTLGPENVGEHFVAITDPGSRLEQLATELKFRHCFLNDPNIGGRFSALSFFGLLPAALIGVDVSQLLEEANREVELSKKEVDTAEGENSPSILGTFIGSQTLAGRDKLTFIFSPTLSPFGAWVEQLIAESTGKEGKGILPVTGEPVLPPDKYGTDRQFVYIYLSGEEELHQPVEALQKAGFPVISYSLDSVSEIGREFFRWEFATAITGYFLKINPFDQPDVESAKIRAREMIEQFVEKGSLPELPLSLVTPEMDVIATEGAPATIPDALRDFLSAGQFGDSKAPGERSYIAIHAYLKPDPAIDHLLLELRTRILTHYKAATSVGYGPRFLHSTGQLFKGDKGNGLFIQLTNTSYPDLPIPEGPGKNDSQFTFGVLKEAQALGDRQAMLEKGRRVIRFHLKGDLLKGLQILVDSIP